MRTMGFGGADEIRVFHSGRVRKGQKHVDVRFLKEPKQTLCVPAKMYMLRTQASHVVTNKLAFRLLNASPAILY
jgi:hypothetical protein